jgi:hypothetical protein
MFSICQEWRNAQFVFILNFCNAFYESNNLFVLHPMKADVGRANDDPTDRSCQANRCSLGSVNVRRRTFENCQMQKAQLEPKFGRLNFIQRSVLIT